MKARYTILLSLALIFSACSTTYYSSAPIEDDIYYSSSDAPMRNVVIEETDVKYKTPKYSKRNYEHVKDIKENTEQEALSKEKAEIEYSGKYIYNDTIPADTIYVEDDQASKEVVRIYMPGVNIGYFDRFYDGYYYGFDPFYFPRSYFSFGFNWGWGSLFYSPFDFGWSWRFGHRYWDPFYSHYYRHHPYYWNWDYCFNPYYYGYGYGYGYNYGYGLPYRNFAKTHTYQHRKNRGRNYISKNQTPRSSRSQSTLNRRTLVNSGTSIGSVATRPDRRGTIENSTTKSTLRNTRSRSNDSGFTKEGNIQLTDNQNRTTDRSARNTNTRSRYSAAKTYSKPKSYASPNNRRPSRSGEFTRSSTNRSSGSSKTIRRVVSSPSKSKGTIRSSSKSGNSRSYSRPVQTRSSKSISGNSSSYRSTKSVSRSSSSSSRSISRSSSSVSRSSGSISRSSSSSSRSSSGSSRSSGGRGRR